MSKATFTRKITSAATALTLMASFCSAQAQSVADPFNALPYGTAVVDFLNPNYYADYKVDLISDNWQVYDFGTSNTRFVGYGWGSFVTMGITRPADQVSSADYSGTIEVTRHDGGLFAFGSVTLFASLSNAPYVFKGWKGATQVFSNSGASEGGSFSDVTNPSATALIDRLEITLTSPGTPDCVPGQTMCAISGTYVSAKDIFLTKASAVPEPTSLALLTAGLAIAVSSRRKRVR